MAATTAFAMTLALPLPEPVPVEPLPSCCLCWTKTLALEHTGLSVLCNSSLCEVEPTTLHWRAHELLDRALCIPFYHRPMGGMLMSYYPLSFSLDGRAGCAFALPS